MSVQLNVKRWVIVFAALIFALSVPLSTAAAPEAEKVSSVLKTYVSRPEENYGCEVVRELKLSSADGFVLKLTSQTWRDIEWTHGLFLVVPHERKYPDKALLVIGGGRNSDRMLEVDTRQALLISYLSEQIGSAVAVLMQVPNQPLIDGRREDDLIAYTFDKFMETGDPDYPLLLPMVKSAVAAMNTVSQWSQKQYSRPIDSFFVTGGSKRGWTTWLTAAVDKRVSGIAPVVIDVLNMEPQMRQQLRTYGRYSQMIQAYVEHSIIDRMGTERANQLLAIVDPYSYRDSIAIPKLIVLGTNDPYWTVDAANLYLDGLTGPTYVHYSPNTGHELSPDSLGGFSTTLLSMVSFVRRHFAGTKMPDFRWYHKQPDTLVVQWDDETAQTLLWSAQSPNRDFRQSRWQSQVLQGKNQVEVKMSSPEQGWAAWFVETRFAGELPLQLSTAITVLPETFPYTP